MTDVIEVLPPQPEHAPKPRVVERIAKVFRRRPAAPETPVAPETRERVSAITDDIRRSTNAVVSGSLEHAIDDAHRRFGLSAQDYHRRILFTPPENATAPTTGVKRVENGTENLAQHFMRVHLPQDGKKRPLIVLVGGNSERLYDPNIGDANTFVYGARHVFESLAATDNFHVVQLKSGDILGGDPRTSTTTAVTHIHNVMRDVFEKQGMFQRIEIDDVRIFGHSYGADIARSLTETEGLIPPHVSVTKAAYVDGVQAGTVLPPRAMRNAGNRVGAYLNIYQRNGALISGAPLEKRDAARFPDDRNIDVSATLIQGRRPYHGHMTSAHLPEARRHIYDPVVDFLSRPR